MREMNCLSETFRLAAESLLQVSSSLTYETRISRIIKLFDRHWEKQICIAFFFAVCHSLGLSLYSNVSKLTIYNNDFNLLVWKSWAMTTAVQSRIRLPQLCDGHRNTSSSSRTSFIFYAVSASLDFDASCYNENILSYAVFLAEEHPASRQGASNCDISSFSSWIDDDLGMNDTNVSILQSFKKMNNR